MDRTDARVDVSPFGLKTDPANPVEGSANQWEGDGLGGLPVEVYSDVDGALKELQERPNEYSSVSVVVYGSPSFLQETVTQAVGMGVVVSGRAWVLVSKVAEWHQSVFPSTLLTYQHNLVLVTPLLRTPRTPAPASVPNSLSSVECFGILKYFFSKLLYQTQGSPTLSLVRNSDGGHYLDGFLGEILRLLQQDLDFRVVVSQIPGFGNRLANGTWIGIVGAVARKEVEVGLASLSISHIRYQVVEFSEHLISTGVFLMYPARQLTQPVSTVFLVFSPERSVFSTANGSSALPGSVMGLLAGPNNAARDRPVPRLLP
ncbi:Glutamate receptor 2 [Portunus trituberculatus]|uniref:Glutamate receptor 2 n=1 Tax=Portunus trituberculatus TaxID=210409 RepID=A0A5B7FFT1_PORTR|nr:Glutamate receptor 2 [Portunus trituberculatus]